jgi:hypothetical protein
LAGLAWACKPWCATLIVLCFALRGVRAGLGTALALAFAMIALPEMVLSPVLMHDYHAMTRAMTVTSVQAFNNLSVLSILERFNQPDWSQHLLEWLPRRADFALRVSAWACAIALFAAGTWIWWRRRPASSYTCAAYLAFMLVPLGICWAHYFVFALPLACVCSFGRRSPTALRALGCVLLAELLGMLSSLEISTNTFWVLFAQPSRYPWQFMAPMTCLACTVLGALALAPREPQAGAR